MDAEEGDRRDISATPARVLVADDNADMRDYLVALLSTRYEVEVVGDGYAALEAARAHTPDVVIADVMMRRLDGFRLVAALRADEWLKTVPVIMISAKPGEAARIEGIEAGADDYLVKPFSARELLARVEGTLRLQHLRRGAAARESDARFRAVVDLVPDLLWQTAPDGSTVWYNARWYEYTGQAPNDAAGSGWMNAVHPDDRARSAAQYARAARTGRPVRQEYRIRAADGTYRWFLVRAEPQKDDAGRIVRWFGAATDVHEQRIAMQDAERQVTERTAELHDAETTRDDLRRQLSSAEEAERRRIARELHDQLGQHLTAFALGLANARRLLDAGHSAESRLAQLEELARLMTRDARYLALELRPPELDDVGLESALRTYIEQWGTRYGVEIDLAVTGAAADAPIPGETGTAIYRIAQEALTNVARYAEAKHVSVVLEKPVGSVRLIIEDDGRGFDVATARTRARHERRIGLAGMRERATLVGGTLEIESTPGRGTTVYARVSLFPSPRFATRIGGDPAARVSRAPNGVRETRLDFAALSRRAAAAIDTSLTLARRREAVVDAVRATRRRT